MYLYYLTVTNFGNIVAVVEVPWVLAVAITFHAAGGALVQVSPVFIINLGLLLPNDNRRSIFGVFIFYLVSDGGQSWFPQSLSWPK
jgi:hypothetical protein